MTWLEERALLTTPTLITLADSGAALTYGQAEIFTATVTTNPPGSATPTGGTVTFLDGTAMLGTQPLTSGTAGLSVPGLGVGIHRVTATYSGTGVFGASSTSLTPPAPVITTVAGAGTAATRQAHYTALSAPSGIVVDSLGNLFICDTSNDVIREVNSSTGAVTTVAGDGTAGYSGDGGQATAAELSDPEGIALDGSGVLFIADLGNNVIREVNLTTGTIATVAGTGGSHGYRGDGGPATSAVLDGPSSVSVDSAGNLFITDTRNNVIREVSSLSGGAQTVTVAPAPLTVTATNATKVYGASNPSLSFTIAGFVNGDSTSVVSGAPVISTMAAPGSGVGTFPITVTAGTLSAADYSFDLVNGILAVTPAQLTITAASQSKQAGQPNPTLAVSYSGFVSGDTSASLSSPPVVTTTATTTSAAGIYPIVVTGAASPNYLFSYGSGTLTVAPAGVTVQRVSIGTIARRKHKRLKVIVVHLSGALNASAAQNLANYTLATVPKGKKKHSKRIALAKAAYSATAMTVTLLTRKKLVLKPPLRLTINATGLGLSEGNVVATIRKSGAKITSAVALGRSSGPSASIADVLLDSGLDHRSLRARR